MMGTFIIAFIGNNVVDSGSSNAGPLNMLEPSTRRSILALGYFGSILAILVTLGVVSVGAPYAHAAVCMHRQEC